MHLIVCRDFVASILEFSDSLRCCPHIECLSSSLAFDLTLACSSCNHAALQMLRSLITPAKSHSAKQRLSASLLDSRTAKFPSSARLSSAALRAAVSRNGCAQLGSSNLRSPVSVAPLPSVVQRRTRTFSASRAQAENPLRRDVKPPLYSEVKAEHVVPGVRAALAEANASLDAIERQLTGRAERVGKRHCALVQQRPGSRRLSKTRSSAARSPSNSC